MFDLLFQSLKEVNGEPYDRIEQYKHTHYLDKKGWSSKAAEENWVVYLHIYVVKKFYLVEGIVNKFY